MMQMKVEDITLSTLTIKVHFNSDRQLSLKVYGRQSNYLIKS